MKKALLYLTASHLPIVTCLFFRETACMCLHFACCAIDSSLTLLRCSYTEQYLLFPKALFLPPPHLINKDTRAWRRGRPTANRSCSAQQTGIERSLSLSLSLSLGIFILYFFVPRLMKSHSHLHKQ